jgi:phage shock protein PspC (stress-responsive transcriptional regulator)
MHFVVATLLGWLVAVPLIYLIMWIAFPEKPLEAQPVSVTGQGNL